MPLSAAPEIAIWTQFVTRFQQAHPDIKINGSYEAWGNYWTKLTTVMAGGAIPDVVWLHYTRMAEWASNQPQANSPRGEGFYTWFAAMGGKLYNADMTQSLVDQPESITALQFMADIINKQHVAPQPGAISQPGDAWLNKLIATTWAHHAEEFFYHEQKSDFLYDEVYYPQGQGGTLVISGGTTGFAIPKLSKHQDQAWTLTTFMAGEEQQMVIVGQHRWAAGLRKLVPTQYSKGYNTPNYVKCHVDPLTGNGPQAVAAPSPAALAQIEQAWGTLLDPVWLGKQQAKDVAPIVKQQMGQALQQKTPI